MVSFAVVMNVAAPFAAGNHAGGCVPTRADPATYSLIDTLDGRRFYVEERDNPFGTIPPIPASGLLGQGTWMYEETNGINSAEGSLQRGGIGLTGPLGQDLVTDENCGHGPDTIVVGVPGLEDPGHASPCPAVPGFGAGAFSPRDYGDAPDSPLNGNPGVAYRTGYTGGGVAAGHFPTLAQTQNGMGDRPGARHLFGNVGWLGNADEFDQSILTSEPVQQFRALGLFENGQPSLEQDADMLPDGDAPATNLDPTLGTPNHDGHDNSLISAGLTRNSQDDGLTIVVATSSGIENWKLNVLIDWNFDGRWAGVDSVNGAPEWAVRNFQVTVDPLERNHFFVEVRVGSTIGQPWTRVTLTPEFIFPQDPIMGWDGSVPPNQFDLTGSPGFQCGETEDHCGRIVVITGTQSPEPSGITCDNLATPVTPCTFVGAFAADLSTGVTNGAQNPWYTVDEHWFVTATPGEPNPDPQLYTVKTHPYWHTPDVGTWVNPWGFKKYDNIYENNLFNAPVGDYVFELIFPTSPEAQAVQFVFDWTRDDSTLDVTRPFEYFDETLGLWVGLALGGGYGPDTLGHVEYWDATPNPSGTYHLRVTVNSSSTFVGLLVEGVARVYCDAIP